MTERRQPAADDELTREDRASEDRKFARHAGARLRESAAELDAATQSRLNRARQRALEELTDKRGVRTGWMVPVGVAAAAAIVVVGVWQSDGTPGGSMQTLPATAEQLDDFELLLDDGLLDEDDLEMIEDLEFFAWLATEDLEAAG
jgi:hypothetical protein